MSLPWTSKIVVMVRRCKVLVQVQEAAGVAEGMGSRGEGEAEGMGSKGEQRGRAEEGWGNRGEGEAERRGSKGEMDFHGN